MSPRSEHRLCVCFLTLMALLTMGADAKAQPPSEVSGGARIESVTPPLAHQIAFFRQVLSKADGDRCPMHPSCSTYALESLQKHGALMGWVMACDRLLRCGHDEIRLSPVLKTRGGPKRYDPVASNDFWWSPPETTPTAGP